MTTIDFIRKMNVVQDLVDAVCADAKESNRGKQEADKEPVRLPGPLAFELYRAKRNEEVDALYRADLEETRHHRGRCEEHWARDSKSWESIAGSLARIADHMDPPCDLAKEDSLAVDRKDDTDRKEGT